MPTTIIELPHVGESVTEGIIGKWLKQPGERVERYDPLVEVVTDKVSMEVPSPYTGTLVKTLVGEGDTVPMGEAIAEMEVEGTVAGEASEGEEERSLGPSTGSGRTGAGSERTGMPAPRADAQSEGTSPALGEVGSSVRGEPAEGRSEVISRPAIRNFEFLDAVRSVGPTGSGEGGQGRPDSVYELESEAGDVRFGEGRPPTGRRNATVSYRHGSGAQEQPFLSPLVRRLVTQYGIDSTRVQGTGKGGRITKDDVLRYVQGQGGVSVRSEPVEGPREAPLSTRTEEDTTLLPLTALRRTIAEHMARSTREIPAAWTMVEADVTGLVRWRNLHKDAFRRSHGVPLTYLAVAAHAVAQALREHPRLNAQWDDGRILLHNRVHLGIAVATDAGLIVPVTHDAGRLSVAGLAESIAALAEAARTQSLKLEDVQRGTFTLNNTGALGSVVSVPVINHPQAAILTTEAIVKRPVVVEGDAIAVRSMMNLCLTFDHRVCDGAEAAGFLQAVKARLEAVDERTPLV